MSRKRKSPVLITVALALLLVAGPSCQTKVATRNRLDENKFPSLVLWAWERPEELESLDPQRFAVAFLAQTIVLKGEEVILLPRRQPLKVSPQTKLIAVTRVESRKTTGARAAFTDVQMERLVTLVLKTLELKNVSAIQLDYDAVLSERSFYRRLLRDLRQKLPDNIALSMTALASFCVGDRWLSDLPVDEAVPMIFRMGADDKTIKSLLANGNDFREPLCRRSYGVAVDEPLKIEFRDSRRRYVFNHRPWTKDDIEKLPEGIWK